MKHVLAIGDIADQPSPVRTVATTPAQTLVKTNDVRQAAGPAVWVQQSDGSCAIRWRGNDTWWDLSARYLQAGKRWREIFNFQNDAFHARVPQPIAIYTTAIVAMPPEAVQHAQLLGELAGGGGVPPTPKPGPGPSPGPGPGPGPGPLGPPVGPSTPVVIPSSPSASDGGHLHWWLLGALGLAGVTTIGVVAYRAHRANAERDERGRRA